jgi:hypothetical protein
MPTEDGRMTAEEFRDALGVIGETVSGFAELLVALGDRANDKVRTVQRWAAGTQDIPGPVQALLQLLVLLQDVQSITPEDVRRWLADAHVPEENDAAP